MDYWGGEKNKNKKIKINAVYTDSFFLREISAKYKSRQDQVSMLPEYFG